jgi:hypothetical protein
MSMLQANLMGIHFFLRRHAMATVCIHILWKTRSQYELRDTFGSNLIHEIVYDWGKFCGYNSANSKFQKYLVNFSFPGHFDSCVLVRVHPDVVDENLLGLWVALKDRVQNWKGIFYTCVLTHDKCNLRDNTGSIQLGTVSSRVPKREPPSLTK